MLYSTGIVYKIVCTQDSGIVYIGSTFNLLRHRWQLHKSQYKRYLDGKHNYSISIYPYFSKYGIENFKILKIKEYDCCREHIRDHKHLEVYEQLWINKTKNCVNKVNPFRILKYNTNVNRERKKEYDKEYKEKNKEKIKEYYEKNKEQRKEYMKEYNENNKEHMKEKWKEYYEKNKEKWKEYNEKNKEKRKEYLKEYYEKTKEQRKEKRKEYYDKNKERMKEYQKKEIECDICKVSIYRGNLSRHEKAQKHIKNLEKNIV